MKFFSLDNPLWNFIGKLIDAIILHILWLICSLPIITFGASTTALFYAMMKDTADESGHYIRDFFKSFKMNFKQGIGFGILALLLIGGLGFASWYYGNVPALGVWGQVFKVVAFVGMMFAVFIFEYAFPLLARFNNTTFQTLKNGMLFAIKHCGWTLLMAGIYIGWYILLIGVPETQILWPIFGLAFPVYVNSYVLNHVLKPYITKAEAEAHPEWADGEGSIIGAENVTEGNVIDAENVTEGNVIDAENVTEGNIIDAENVTEGNIIDAEKVTEGNVIGEGSSGEN